MSDRQEFMRSARAGLLATAALSMTLLAGIGSPRAADVQGGRGGLAGTDGDAGLTLGVADGAGGTGGVLPGANGGNGGSGISGGGGGGGQYGNGAGGTAFVNNPSGGMLVGGNGGIGGPGDGLSSATSGGSSPAPGGGADGGGAGSFGGAGVGLGEGANGGGGAGGAGARVISGTNSNAGLIQGGAGGTSASGGALSGNGGGGGGGGSGVSFEISPNTLINTGTILGGHGGNGGSGGGNAGVGGGGGGGGYGIFGPVNTVTNSGTIQGGAGGAGGAAPMGMVGSGGAGGDGINGASTIMNNFGATIAGGAGGPGGNANFPPGPGGRGIFGAGLSIVTAGAINGGLGGDGVTRADAITFFGFTNRLELQAGWSFIGNIDATNGTNTLALGGATDSSFPASNIGSQFVGFQSFEKTGTSTWQLTGATTALTPWNILGGTLQISSDEALGDPSGTLTIANGTTLATTASFTSARTTTLNAGGGTFDAAPGTTFTMSGVIGGVGSLTKVDSGTLVLTNTNIYQGGTAINGGTVQVSADNNLGAQSGPLSFNGGTLNATATFTSGRTTTLFSGGGTFDVNPDTTLTLSGAIGGSGGLTKVDSGTLVFTGANNTYTGGTTISAGTLQAGVTDTLSPNSAVTVAVAGKLDLNGFNQTVPGVTNAGLVNMGTGTSPITRLTTTSYVGQGGTIAMNTYLSDDPTLSDRLVINGGTATGNTFLHFTNVGGPGAQTVANGILVVDAIGGGTTAAGAFTLGNPELRAGAFDYRLFQGGPDGSDLNNWYLRSTFVVPPGPPEPPPEPPFPPTPPTPGPGTFPIIGPELATYGVVQPMAQQLGRAMLGTHDERLGDLYPVPCEPAETDASNYTKAPVYTKAPTNCSTDGWRPAVWGRLFGQQIDNHYQAFADPRTDGQIAGFQAGIDLLRSDSLIAGHRDYAGVFAAYGNANVDVTGLVTNAAATAFVLQHTGALNLNAYSGGAYWTHYGPQGWYLDLVLQGTSYSGAASTEFAHLNTSGSGFISSAETGYPIALPQLGFGFVLEPQAQVLWQWVSFDSGNDGLGPVALGTTSETTARVGLKGKWTITTDSGQVWQPYVRANYWSDFGGTSATLFGPDSVPLISHAQYMDVGAGFTTKINTHLSAFADAGYQFAVSNDGGRRDGVKGTAGLRYQW